MKIASLMRRLLYHPKWALWLYLALLVTVCLAIYWGGDRWWLSTIMMFGPKWIYVAPLPILVIWLAVARASRREWLTLLVVTCVLLFPTMRLCLPWRTLVVSRRADIRLLTWNTGGNEVDTDPFKALIARVDPDIICLQECRVDLGTVFPESWTILRSGNIVIATPWDCDSQTVMTRQHPPSRWPRPICHLIQVHLGAKSFHIATLHLQSPRYGLVEVTDSQTMIAPTRRMLLVAQTQNRRAESNQVSQRLADVDGPLIIAGDFNTPTCSTIYRECWGMYKNSFSIAGFGIGNTVRVEQGGFQFAARVDHILTSQHWAYTECWVGPDVGSDHVPLIASFYRR